jgi:cleavage and polyadenylation specificity factor subunit 4
MTDISKSKLPLLIPIQNQPNMNQPLQTQYIIQDSSIPHSVFFENSRFFIIKSSNKENVELSQKYSEWATTVTNQKKLNEAFQSSNVILIFSVNKSGNFQGYALMTSLISDKVSNIWQNESSVKLGGSFTVQWLSICEMPFSKVKNMVNPINNEFVIKSRDTQELPKEIGISLCSNCYEQEKFESSYKTSKPLIVDQDTVNKIQEEIKKNRESNIFLNIRIFPKAGKYD